MISNALSGKPLPVYGDGSNVRDWIFVDDHCQGLWLAFEKAAAGAVYNFGGREEWDNVSLVKKLCTTLDELRPRSDGKKYEQQVNFVTDRLGHDKRYAIDDSKAKEELGFTRSVNFEQGLKQTVQWYLDNGDWCKQVLKAA